MNSTSKIVGPIVAVVLLGGAVALVLNTRSDRAKFDQLRVGMTTREVQAIVGPKTGGYNNRFHTDIGDNDTLHINDVMHLTIRNGRLVEKKWVGKDRGEESRRQEGRRDEGWFCKGRGEENRRQEGRRERDLD